MGYTTIEKLQKELRDRANKEVEYDPNAWDDLMRELTEDKKKKSK